MPDTVDHTGQTFASERAMCRFWGVGSVTFRQRRQRGWSVEAALTGVNPTAEASHVDHTGQVFTSAARMRRHWGVDKATFSYRRKHGWPLKAALTGANPNAVSQVDHTGQVFTSERAMCAHWNIFAETYRARRKRGLSVAEALTAPRLPHAARGKPVVFDGKRYSNIRAFLRAHGYRGNSVYARLRADGLSQEAALTWIARHAPLPDEK